MFDSCRGHFCLSLYFSIQIHPVLSMPIPTLLPATIAFPLFRGVVLHYLLPEQNQPTP